MSISGFLRVKLGGVLGRICHFKYDMMMGHIRLIVLRSLGDKGFVAVFIAKEDEVRVTGEGKQNDKAKPKSQCTEIFGDASGLNKIGGNFTIEVNGVPDRKHIDDCDSNQKVSHDMSEAVEHGHLARRTVFGNISLNLWVLKTKQKKLFPLGFCVVRRIRGAWRICSSRICLGKILVCICVAVFV